MRTLFTFWAILWSVFSLAQESEIPEVNITIHVDDGYRPFSYAEDKEAKGIYIDVLKVAFSRMEGYNVSIQPIPWKRGKKMAENGEIMGLAPAFFHGHDWGYVFPYSLPFYTETIVSICRPGVMTQDRDNWPSDYIGLKIGNISGFGGWGGDEFHKLVEEGKISYQENKGSQALIKKLLVKRVDCIMMESAAFDFEFSLLKEAETRYENAVVHKAAIIGEDPVYIGYSRPWFVEKKEENQLDFMQKFDSEIYKMTKSGEIKEIMGGKK